VSTEYEDGMAMQAGRDLALLFVSDAATRDGYNEDLIQIVQITAVTTRQSQGAGLRFQHLPFLVGSSGVLLPWLASTWLVNLVRTCAMQR
jgi:hypothetical protein